MPRRSRRSRAASERNWRGLEKKRTELSCPEEQSIQGSVKKRKTRCSSKVTSERKEHKPLEHFKENLCFAHIKGQPYVVEALSKLQSYDAVMEKLGSPLQMHEISFDPSENVIDRLVGKVQVKIPLTGSKGSSAYLYIWARRPPITIATQEKDLKNWTIRQLDIELGPLRRWTFYVNTDQWNNGEVCGFHIPKDVWDKM